MLSHAKNHRFTRTFKKSSTKPSQTFQSIYLTFALRAQYSFIKLTKRVIMLANTLVHENRRLCTLLILFQQRILPLFQTIQTKSKLMTKYKIEITSITLNDTPNNKEGVIKLLLFRSRESEQDQYVVLRLCVFCR